jgi:alpha-L-fucosidase
MFSDAGPDIRWIGNERGSAGEYELVDDGPERRAYPGADGAGIIAAAAERRPEWDGVAPRRDRRVDSAGVVLSHPAEDAKVKTVDDLVDLYFTSVGRNSKLLLNVPPTRADCCTTSTLRE